MSPLSGAHRRPSVHQDTDTSTDNATNSSTYNATNSSTDSATNPFAHNNEMANIGADNTALGSVLGQELW